MAKIVMSFRVRPEMKVWIERKAKNLNTTDNWIVEQAILQFAGDELRTGFDISKPEPRSK